MRAILLITVICIISYISFAQQEIFLYGGLIPNSKNIEGIRNISVDAPKPFGKIDVKVVKPSITSYLPTKEKIIGAAVLICPGGGYLIEASELEGEAAAKRFCEEGITGFVLHYRLPDPSVVQKKEIAPIQDAQQALVLIRKNAKRWGIDPNCRII